ncbi:MAG: GntR family transcriptional regulator [Desulfobacteraceae bacterium]|nr:MAG: GntR family transcriptional regulator [Desulfobacteraceae bacterium]
MNITISTSLPFSIKEQLKRQLKAMIEQGSLPPGHRLLSAKDLALYLDINRNTVAAVYKELALENLVTISKGSGTTVMAADTESPFCRIQHIFSKAYDDALKTGLSRQEIVDAFISHTLMKSTLPSGRNRLILVDCNYDVLKSLDVKLKATAHVETHFTLIQDIEAMPEKFIRRSRSYDLVICGMNHMEELKAAVPEPACEVTGFLLKTDFRIMDRITRLPAGTTVGYCCVTQKSAETFFKRIVFSSGSTLEKIYAGMDNPDALARMAARCDVIFATQYAHDQLTHLMGTSRDIIRVDLDIDPDNLSYILSIIEQEP